MLRTRLVLSAACLGSPAMRFAQAVASAGGSATTWLAGAGADGLRGRGTGPTPAWAPPWPPTSSDCARTAPTSVRMGRLRRLGREDEDSGDPLVRVEGDPG